MPRFCLLLSFISICVVLPLFPSRSANADEPRVSALYTAWDDYFFYAAFEVNDHNVISTNRTPISQPQQDDDVELFINTKPGSAGSVRTSSTYQMAVSAGSGCYFSVGDGTKIPKAKLVLTYKYAVTIDGTLNDPSDNDTGYTVEVAIPWQELGQSGPPAAGQTWGFNAISRNRDNLDTPSQSFVSLSPTVAGRDDIQDPSKWSKINFISTLANQTSTPNQVYCPRITSDTNYPVIDGVVRSGEWNTNFGLAFGSSLIAGAAPSKDEEPNISESPFSTLIQPVIQTPQVTDQAVAPATTPATGPDYTISLPGGGEVHVGKIKVVPPPPVVPAPTVVGSGHHKFVRYPGTTGNPLEPNLPQAVDVSSTIGPQISPDATLSLVNQTKVAALIVAPYYFTYPASFSPTYLIDQPIDGLGPAFGGNHTEWHKNQLVDARRGGIDVLLPVIDPTDPQSEVGLSALVEAMKELKTEQADYPLLGLKVRGADIVGALKEFLSVVPEEFRAEAILPDSLHNQRAYIVFVNTLPGATATQKLSSLNIPPSDTLLITTTSGTAYLQIATVSPGGVGADGKMIGRSETNTLQSSWESVYTSDVNWVYVDSWNDYQQGTEIAASRQYGEEYDDLNRLSTLKWSGADQWDAKYLANNVPAVIAQKTIYTVSLRIENNGSLPWRAGENYALCYRWYKDGRLYDDSAPRLPLSNDLYPGDSATINIGVVAQNSFGKDIEPGSYTLVFDMVQGQSRWFSYVGSRPLRIPVRVEDTIDSPQYKPIVISSTTPAILDTQGTYSVSLFVRNEGQETWDPKTTKVTVAGNRAQSDSTLAAAVYPGAIGQFTTSLRVPEDELPGHLGTITWTVTTPGGTTNWTEHPMIVARDLGASFTINDVPRTVKCGSTVTAKVGVANLGPYTWTKTAWKVGYEWLSIDGTPAVKRATAGTFDEDADAGVETAVDVSLKAPNYPGKYQLVLDIVNPEGETTLDEPTTRGCAILPMVMTVEEDKDASTRSVDLNKYFSVNGEGAESTADAANFDGAGSSLPAVFMPPDGTQELNVDPILLGKPGQVAYPSGYYSATIGPESESDHRISFIYGSKSEDNVVVCKGQRIDIDAGNWKRVHFLAAATGDDNVVTTAFTFSYSDGDSPVSTHIASWLKVPDPADGTVGLRLPYRLNGGAIVDGNPIFLGDYALSADTSRKLEAITLPNNPQIKVLAITLER